jgi:hypothetical protein
VIAARSPAKRMRVSVLVAEAPHLCRVQSATRALCRSAGLNEGDVFSAVIAVTELAHRHFIEGARSGGVELAIVRHRNGLSLDVRAKNAGSGAPACARLNFPPTETYES